jgi:hypothetical protein
MTVAYQVRTYTPAGVLTAVITDFLELSYSKKVNAPGLLMFVLPDDDDAIAYFELDAQVEVWRRDLERAIDWYCDFRAFWRGERRQADSNGTTRYTAICPGQMDLLKRSLVAYPAGTDDRNTFVSEPAETIIKNLVKYNATSSGTTGDGRERTVTTSGITIQTDGATGTSIDYTCAWQNLLSSCQEVALTGGGDFDLVKTGSRAWEFRWYLGQLGTDRSATITFALQYGNMANPQLTRDYTGEKTVAIVGGQGEEASRTVVVRNGANYDATENAVETFVDARQMTTTNALNNRGDTELESVRQRNQLTFDVLQVPSTLYGQHYFLGDLVTGYYEGITTTQRIVGVSVSLDSKSKETIKVELSDV